MKWAYLLFFGAFLLLLHHYLLSGNWYDWRDIENHEFAIALLIGLGSGMLIGRRLKKA
jgi:hypothetical protein